MITNDSIYSAINESPNTILEYRRDRIKILLNKEKEIEEVSLDKSSTESDDEGPFERLVKTISKTNLSTEEKKTQIHYDKYALNQMDDQQAETFEQSIKTLLLLRKQNQNRRSQSNGVFNTLIEEYLEKLEASLEKLEEAEKKIKEKTENSDPIEDGINTLLEASTKEPFHSLNLFTSEQLIEQYVTQLNEEYEKITLSSKSTEEEVVNLVV